MKARRSIAGRSVVSTLVLVVAVGCAGRKAVWEQEGTPQAAPAPAPTDELTTLEQQFEALWAQRGETAKLQEAIGVLEQLVAKAPTPDRLARLARAYYFLADGHYALQERTDEMMAAFEKGLEAGERGVVAASPEFAEKMRNDEKAEEAIKVVGKDAVPAVYWYSVNLGKWARAQGITKVLFYKDKIRAYLERVLELDPNYFYAAPTRYFGAFFAVAPSYAGGDLQKSEEFFNKSLATEPNYLATKVLMAENLATKKQDRAMFDKLLQEVLAADAKVIPEIEPEQLVEKKKAERLMAKADDLF